VEAATILTPQGRDMQTNNFKTNLQIERLFLEKRACVVPGKPTDCRHQKQHIKEATRTLNRALKQETENAQLRYIKKLSPTSTKHPLWEGSPKTELSNRKSHSDKKFIWQLGPQRRRQSRNFCFTSQKRLPAETCHWFNCPTTN